MPSRLASRGRRNDPAPRRTGHRQARYGGGPRRGLPEPRTLRQLVGRRKPSRRLARTLSIDEIVRLLQSIDLGTILPNAAVTQLSGGQQKRLALLRALLRGSQFVVLDEPTSGLDPGTASKVAEMLGQSLKQNPRSLLLVTHDYETAARLCERVLLLTSEGRLQDVTPSPGTDRDEVIRQLRHALASNVRQRAGMSGRPMPWGTVALTLDFLGLGLPIALIAMALMGAMLVAQSAGMGPIDISSHIPGALVLAVFREMSPLLVGLLLASRIGARVGSELAGMSYTSQLDSMRVLGLSPASHLLIPFLVSACIVFPVTIVSSGTLSIFAGGFYASLPISGLSIGTSRFLDLASEAIDPLLIISGIIKGVVMAILIVLGSYWSVTRPITSAPALGSAVTRAAVLGSAAIVVTDVVLSWIFFA